MLENEKDVGVDVGRVTCLSSGTGGTSLGDWLFIGYQNGFMSAFDHDKKRTKSFKLEGKAGGNGSKVTQIEDLP